MAVHRTRCTPVFPKLHRLVDRVCGWLHNRAILKVGSCRLFHMGLLTHHSEPDQILSLSFLGGAGYVPNSQTRDTCTLRGFSVYLRLNGTDLSRYRGWRDPYPRFVITCSPNRYAV